MRGPEFDSRFGPMMILRMEPVTKNFHDPMLPVHQDRLELPFTVIEYLKWVIAALLKE